MLQRTSINVQQSSGAPTENIRDSKNEEQQPATQIRNEDETPLAYLQSSSTMQQILNAASRKSSEYTQPDADDPAPTSPLAPSQQIKRFMDVYGVTEAHDFAQDPSSVKVPLKFVPGKVLYFNWDLYEQITRPDVPGDRVMTPELIKAILDRYCKVIDKGRTAENAETIGYADKYWHSNSHDDRVGMGGSGRACFLETGENLKGIGPTPLAPTNEGADNDGKLSLEEAVAETVAGELCAHLMDNRSTRVLAIIEPDDPNADTIIIRVGNHLREAHFDTWRSGDYEKLLDMGFTVEQLMQMQAETAAAMNQYRLLHGAVDPGNMGMFGTQIDLGTMTTQPRTEPITNLYYMNQARATSTIRSSRLNRLAFGAEHKAFFKYLKQILPPWRTLSWKSIYRHARNVETLMGCGLKKAVAEQLLQQEPDKAHQLAKHIRRLGRWYHDNVPNTVPDEGGDWDRSALADNHKMMAELPAVFFDPATGAPRTARKQDIFDTLDLDIKRKEGTLPAGEKWREDVPLKKYAISSPSEGIAKIRKSVNVILSHYPEMMERAAAIGMNNGAYESRQDFVASLEARAKFENAPIEAMYAPNVTAKVNSVIDRYDENTNKDDALENLSAEVSLLISNIVSSSKRRIDDLLFNTQVRSSSDVDTWRLQMQNIDGVLHYIEADASGRRDLCLDIPLASLSENQLAALSGAIEQENLDCQWTGTMPQTSTAIVSVENAGFVENGFLKVRIPAEFYQYGQFAGKLRIGDEELAFGEGSRKYTCAVPDSQELGVILKKVDEADDDA